MCDHVVELCEKMLQQVVTPDTVHMLLEASEMTNAHQLKNVCLHFLRNEINADSESSYEEEKRRESKKCIYIYIYIYLCSKHPL